MCVQTSRNGSFKVSSVDVQESLIDYVNKLDAAPQC